MRRQSTNAGGCFLTSAILLGALWGILAGKAMVGVLIGTGIGIAVAIAVWLVDRSRGRSRH